jgi:hypothetical protein
MRVGILQSNFIPWRGYFDLIDDVDLFIFYDDVQYTKNDWRNRNKIKTPQGLAWITVPVFHRHLAQLICETEIDYTQPWATKIKKRITQCYFRAPYFERYANIFFGILDENFRTISELNVHIILWIMQELRIKTRTMMSRDTAPLGVKMDRLIDILTKVGASEYLSGPAAKNYMELEKFKDARIGLAYKAYDYDEYPQLFGPYKQSATILDLLFNLGPDARAFLKSRRPNEKVL